LAEIEDSPQCYAADILAVNPDRNSFDLVHALCEVGPRYLEWLANDLEYTIQLGNDVPRSGNSMRRQYPDVNRTGSKYLIPRVPRAMNDFSNIAYIENIPENDLLTDDIPTRRRRVNRYG